MRSVGINVLKNRLSEYVRLAASGETVLVTDRDRVVAELGPPRSDKSLQIADRLWADAVRKGEVRPAPLRGRGSPPRKPVMRFEELMADLQQDREGR